ncbi:MAG: hypothetical protein M3Q45_07995 [Chloroflexota bacterium]|nr:hypothetical protein [Chloroflexota bacterium]
MTILVQELVAAGVYPDTTTAIQEALRVLWQERPEVRIHVALHRHRTEGFSIAKTVALAGVSFDRMEILVAHGMPLHLGPETIAEARSEVEALRAMRT